MSLIEADMYQPKPFAPHDCDEVLASDEGQIPYCIDRQS